MTYVLEAVRAEGFELHGGQKGRMEGLERDAERWGGGRWMGRGGRG